MEVTQQQAYEAALMLIGRLTVEQHFYQAQIAEQAAENQRPPGDPASA